MESIFIYITTPTKKVAIKIAKRLLKERLIACANIFPITSLYWWKEKIAEENEFVLIGKTVEKNFEKVKDVVERTHPYEIPCIAKIPVSLNKKFLIWLKAELKVKRNS